MTSQARTAATLRTPRTLEALAVRGARGLVLGACLALPLSTASAQEEAPLVDRAVADLDPLATSTRRIDPAYGNDLNRDRVRLLRPADGQAGTSPVYGIEGPGYRATFNRPDYLTLSADGIALNRAPIFDGAYIDIIPPNTVFDLTSPATTWRAAPPSPEAIRLRVDTRVTPGDGPPYLRPYSSLTPLPYVIPDAAPGGEPVTLQPWVTADDLRQPSGIEYATTPALTQPVGPDAHADSGTAPPALPSPDGTAVAGDQPPAELDTRPAAPEDQ